VKASVQKADRVESRLSVVASAIPAGTNSFGHESRHVGEIEPALTQVTLPLLLVSFQIHPYTTYLIVATK
jgi:hypothetical protein